MRLTIRTAVITLALVLAGCAGSGEEEPTQPEDPGTPAPTATASPTEEPTDTGPTSGDDATPDAESTPVPDSELPGESVQTFFAEGVQADVIGVEHDDVLFVRQLPDPESAEVARFEPTDVVTSTGRERSVDEGLWVEVEISAGVGWVSMSYLGFLGRTQDVTADYQDVPPTAEEAELVASVGERTAEQHGTEGPTVSWTIIGTPQDEDPETYLVDVLGYPDDATYGERLRVTVADEGDGYSLHSVESTAICGRGVSDDGLCV